jgi:hypothetical protein
MSFKKQDTGRSVGREQAILKMLNQLAMVETLPDAVNIKFPTLEGAMVFKDQFEPELGWYYAGKTLRWTGTAWNNKLECEIVQVGMLARMLKWSPEKYEIRRGQEGAACRCYSCARRH